MLDVHGLFHVPISWEHGLGVTVGSCVHQNATPKGGPPYMLGGEQPLRTYNISFVNSFANNFISRFPNPQKKSWVYFHLEMV